MTTEISRNDELAGIYSDIYKSIHGVRPRWISFSEMTLQQLEEAVEELDKEYVIHAQQEKLREQEAIKVFEARVQSIIDMGAKTRETAIRWLHTACDTHGDNDYLCWEFHIPYGYIK